MSGGRVRVPQGVQCLLPFVDAGMLAAAEVHLADWVARAGGVTEPEVLLGAAMATWAPQHGHSCAELVALPDVVLREHARELDTGEATAAGGSAGSDGAGGSAGSDGPVGSGGPELPWPNPQQWVAALAASPVVRVVQGPDPQPVLDQRPLVLWGTRLYLQRHWVDECAVAASLRQRVAAGSGSGAVGAAASEVSAEVSAEMSAEMSAEASTLLEALLPAIVDGEPNLQRHAAHTVLRNQVSLLVGGPGTGKTYSLARILAVLLTDASTRGVSLRIALAAPTGKAAARMQESIATALSAPEVLGHVPQAVHQQLAALVPSTIHRLLGSLAPAQQHRFQHDAANPLPHDVVVIDETSMVSAPLMARLLEAVRPEAKLLLIGDPDQLESVELGAVLGDIVAVAAPPDGSGGQGPLAGAAVRLLRARRFEKGSPIALLADAVRAQDSAEAIRVLDAPPAPEARSTVQFLRVAGRIDSATDAAVAAEVSPFVHAAREAALAGNATAALDAMAEVRILCAHRHGPYGVSHWNRAAEQWLFGPAGTKERWYPGRPLLVTRNDARLGLSNGDTGVVVAREGGVAAVFSVGGSVAEFDPVQLADIETAFAMTVHKSQGSEYPTVVFVLPPAASPLAGRELVYTGATRAKGRLVVVGDDDAVRQALATRALRMTGLTDSLR